ncbi:MAG TPA: CBS domain-containing protein [Candidatus Limnocylindria bacterium]
MPSEFRVGNLMSIDPVTIESNAPVAEAERLLKTHRISGLPVVEGGATVGVISQTDIMIARSSELISGNWGRLTVRHIMTSPAVTVHLETSLRRAAGLMVERHIHRLVVIDGEGRAVGVITPLDLLTVLLTGESPVPDEVP